MCMTQKNGHNSKIIFNVRRTHKIVQVDKIVLYNTKYITLGHVEKKRKIKYHLVAFFFQRFFHWFSDFGKHIASHVFSVFALL